MNKYINEKLVISKTISNNEKLVMQLCNRLVENDNMVDEKFKKVINDWIDKNKVKDINRDIFYTISNQDKVESVVQDTSFIKASSKLNTVSDVISKYKLDYLLKESSYYAKYRSTYESLYVDHNKLLFIKKERTKLKFTIYMNAWVNEVI